jgi:formyltetrahydrofolate deformylase
MAQNTARLLITCPDRRGIIAAVAGFIAENDGNILYADQHTDPHSNEFFMRVEVDAAGFGLDEDSFEPAWSELATRYGMRWRIHWQRHRKAMAILVGREGHCLTDLLWRWDTGEIDVDIPLVISNHADLETAVTPHGVAFHHLPVTPETKPEQEEAILGLLEAARIDLVVLARYMQVLTPGFVARYPERIINIHHSFLPAFAGARPYHQAYERGVKVVGATSHYVTDDLDDGPIIAQQTLAVGHRDTIDDLTRKGRDLERVVLAAAVRLHVQDKILISGTRTIVFD